MAENPGPAENPEEEVFPEDLYDDDVRTCFAVGRMHAEDKKYLLALQHFGNGLDYLGTRNRRDFALDYLDLLKKCYALEGFTQTSYYLKEALTYFKRHTDIYRVCAEIYFQNGKYHESSEAFTIARRYAKNDEQWLRANIGFENVRTHLFDQWHWRMLNNAKRNHAFAGAIKDAVSEARKIFGPINFVALDIGSGTGILSVMLLNHMKRYCKSPICHCLDSNPAMYMLCEDTFAYNNVRGAKLYTTHSFHFVPPQLSHIAVSETLDCAIFGEKIASTLLDAWERLLDPAACVVPKSASYYVALLESVDIEEQHSYRTGDYIVLSQDCYLDGFSTDLPIGYDCFFLRDLERGYRLLSEPLKVLTVDFSEPQQLRAVVADRVNTIIELNATTAGRAVAVVGWFDAEIGPRNRISTAPEAGSCWAQAIFPFQPAVEIKPNESLQFNLFVKKERMYIRPVKLPPLTVQPLRASDELNLPMMNDLRVRKFFVDSINMLASEHYPLRGLDCTDLLIAQQLGKQASKICICSDRPILRYVRPNSVDYSLCEPTPRVLLHWPFNVRGLIDYTAIYKLQDVLQVDSQKSLRRTVLIPSRMVLRGFLVSSPELWRRGGIVPEEEELDTYADVGMVRMRYYGIHYYEGVDLKRIPHKRMSDTFEFMDIDMMELLLSEYEERLMRRPFIAKITAAGTCHAMVYWYDLYAERCGTSFSLLELPEHAIGYFLPEPKDLQVGDELEFTLSSARLQQIFEFPALFKENALPAALAHPIYPPRPPRPPA